MLPVWALMIVTLAVFEIVPATADMVIVPSLLAAVKVIFAVPVPPDVEENVFESVPRLLSSTEKLTKVPSSTGLPIVSVTTAVIVAVPPTMIVVDGVTVVTIAAGGGAVIVRSTDEDRPRFV
jgi:hypothetical protein